MLTEMRRLRLSIRQEGKGGKLQSQAKAWTGLGALASSAGDRGEQVEAVGGLDRGVQAGDVVVDVDDELPPEELARRRLGEGPEGRIALGEQLEDAAQGGVRREVQLELIGADDGAVGRVDVDGGHE